MTNTVIKKIEKHYKIQYLMPFGLSVITGDEKDFTKLFSGNDLIELVKQFKMILLRGFDYVSSEKLVDYAKTMGPLLEWEFGSVMEMKVHESPKNYLFTHSHVPFHWDGAFHKEPRYLLFNCILAPHENSGGETLFTDTSKIFNDATGEEKKLWSGYQLKYKTEKLAHYGGEMIVPLVQQHIDTGEFILRFAEPVPHTLKNPVDVKLINIDQNTSEDFLKAMSSKCYDKKYCYTHIWKKNDFLIADNFSLLHARNAFKEFTPRHLRRVQVL